MHISRLEIRNSGPIESLSLTPMVAPEGTKQPIILVGGNGSGKTTLISLVTDALVELASLHYQDVVSSSAAGRNFFRLVGGTNVRQGSAFELAAVEFEDVNSSAKWTYKTKSGSIPPEVRSFFQRTFSSLGEVGDEPKNLKQANGPNNQVEAVLSSGAYAYFPSDRFELPHWINLDEVKRDPEPEFTPNLTGRLGRPLIVRSALKSLRPWLIDVLLDQRVDLLEVIMAVQGPQFEAFRQSMFQRLPTFQVWNNANMVVRLATGREAARVVRLGRAAGERRIAIADGDDIIFPTLNHLSSGQASLVSIFLTLVRYADLAGVASLGLLEGIVAIDEADTHLHVSQQFTALPSLIRLFPKVQFIISAHSPLFVLGMRNSFGEDGCIIVDLPSGSRIDAESYAEFGESFVRLSETWKFEAELEKVVAGKNRPVMLCEGHTDPKYLKTAMELLGFNDLLASVDLDWIGVKAASGSENGGKEALDAAGRFLKSNAKLVSRLTILLYDLDAKKADFSEGKFFVRSFLGSPVSTLRYGGVEMHLPDAALEERFFQTTTKLDASGDQVIRRSLRKSDLCDHLCDVKREPSDFEGFRPTLEMLRELASRS